MSTLELTIQHRRQKENWWPVTAHQSGSDTSLPTSREGKLHLDLDELYNQATHRAYGTYLGQALFQDEIWHTFVQAQNISEQKGEVLRVLLSIEDDELRHLHWERLCVKVNNWWNFLLLNQRAPFSLYLPSPVDHRFPLIGRRGLKALVVVSNPQNLNEYNLSPIDEAAIISNIQAALGEIPYDILAANSESIGPPTLDELCRQLSKEQYSLLHIVAHGQYGQKKQEEMAIHLVNHDNNVDSVPASRFMERLATVQKLPRFVFLAACEGGTPETAMEGLAQQLVRELGIPAVVAMTEKVSIQTVKLLTSEFYQHLYKHGQVDLALAEATAHFAGRSDVAVLALYSRLGDRPLFSDTLDRALTPQEIEYGLDTLEVLLEDRAPSLLTKFKEQAYILRSTLRIEDAALTAEGREQRNKAQESINKTCESVIEVTFNGLAIGSKIPPYNPRCPFPGLSAFHAEDREFFFGREALVGELIEKLHHHNFLVILGPSGSGKSSVIRAGLIPALREQTKSLQVEIFVPGKEPKAKLDAALQRLNEDHNGVDTRLLVVDQFEELFTLTPHEKRQPFLDHLLAQPSLSFKIILIMRADFLGECVHYSNLRNLVQEHQELIGPMTTDELRTVMDKQAEAVGLRFEEDLSHRILEEVSNEPGKMPLLQYALSEMWKRRHGRWLRREAYRELGGVTKAIAKTADEIYEKLEPEEQNRMKNIFIRLTRLDEERIYSEERRDTRWRVPFEDLVAPARSDPTPTRDLVRRLAGEGARLVVTTVNEVTGREEVEVAHEALIQHWPRLRDWLDDDREGVYTHKRLYRNAQEWQQNGRQSSYLYLEGRLENAILWIEKTHPELNALEQEFLDASKAEQKQLKTEQQKQKEERQRLEQQKAEQEKRAKQRTRIIWIVVAILAIALVVIGIVSWLYRETLNAKSETDAVKLALASANQLNINYDLALLLAIESARESESLETNTALRRALLHRGRTIAYLSGSEGEKFNQVILSPNGENFLTISDKCVKIWEMGTWKRINEGICTHYHIQYAAWSPEGQYIAVATTGEGQETAQIWTIDGTSPLALLSHTNAVNYVAWNQDGTRLATASQNKTVTVWDVTKLKPSSVFSLNHEEPVEYVAWNKNNSQLLTITNRHIYLWNINEMTGTQALVIDNVGRTVGTVLWSPDETHILSVDHTIDGNAVSNVYIWNTQTGEREQTLPHPSFINQALWEGSERVITAGEDGIIRVWDIVKAEIVMTLTGHEGAVTNIAWDVSEKRLVSTSTDDIAVVWNMDSGEELARLTGHRGNVNQAIWNQEGSYIISVSDDETIRVWDPSLGAEAATLIGHSGNIRYIAWSPDDTKIATASEDKTARIWDADTGKILHILDNHEEPVNQAVWSPNGAYVVTVGNEDSVRFWDATTGELLCTASDHEEGVVNQADWYENDGTLWVATAGEDRTARVWIFTPTHTITLVHTFPMKQETVNQAVWSHQGAHIAVAAFGTGTFSMQVWDAISGKRLLAEPGHKDNVGYIDWSANDKKLVTASDDRTAIVWDAITGEQIVQLTPGHTGIVKQATWHPQNDLVLTASDDGYAIIWDVKQGISIHVLSGHQNSVNQANWNADGTHVVTASDDKTAWIWDAANGQHVATLEGHTTFVNQAVWDNAGRRIVTASSDKTARIYYASHSELLIVACQRAVRNMTQDEWEQFMGEEPYEQTCPEKSLLQIP